MDRVDITEKRLEVKGYRTPVLSPDSKRAYPLDSQKYGGRVTVIYGGNPDENEGHPFLSPVTLLIKITESDGTDMRDPGVQPNEFALSFGVRDQDITNDVFLTNLDKSVMIWGSGKRSQQLSAGSGQTIHLDEYPNGFWVATGPRGKVMFYPKKAIKDQPPYLSFRPMKVGQI